MHGRQFCGCFGPPPAYLYKTWVGFLTRRQKQQLMHSFSCGFTPGPVIGFGNIRTVLVSHCNYAKTNLNRHTWLVSSSSARFACLCTFAFSLFHPPGKHSYMQATNNGSVCSGLRPPCLVRPRFYCGPGEVSHLSFCFGSNCPIVQSKGRRCEHRVLRQRVICVWH